MGGGRQVYLLWSNTVSLGLWKCPLWVSTTEALHGSVQNEPNPQLCRWRWWRRPSSSFHSTTGLICRGRDKIIPYSMCSCCTGKGKEGNENSSGWTAREKAKEFKTDQLEESYHSCVRVYTDASTGSTGRLGVAFVVCQGFSHLISAKQTCCQTENKRQVAKAVGGIKERRVELQNTKENWGNEESGKKQE